MIVSHNRRMLHRLPQQLDLLSKAIRCWSEWWVLATVFSSGLHETSQTIVLLNSCNLADPWSCVISLACVVIPREYLKLCTNHLLSDLNFRNFCMWPFLHLEEQVTVYLQVSYLCAVSLILLQKLPEHLSEMARDSIQDDNQHTETDEFIKTQQDLPGGIIGTIQNSHLASSFGNQSKYIFAARVANRSFHFISVENFCATQGIKDLRALDVHTGTALLPNCTTIRIDMGPGEKRHQDVLVDFSRISPCQLHPDV